MTCLALDAARRMISAAHPDSWTSSKRCSTQPTKSMEACSLEWCGGPFDPNDIDEKRIRMIFSWFADQRRGPLMSHRNGRRRESQ